MGRMRATACAATAVLLAMATSSAMASSLQDMAAAMGIVAGVQLQPMCGDATGDGRVTSSDALAILRCSVDLVVCDVMVCDADGNGVVSSTDALLVLRLAVGLTDPPVACPPPTTTTTSTSSTTSTTLYPPGCPVDGPLGDLRLDCLPLVYVYWYEPEALIEALATDGIEIAVGQTDGVDLLLYAGTVSSQTTAQLSVASFNGGSFMALDPDSSAELRDLGALLDLTIRIDGQRYRFRGASWQETVRGPATLPTVSGDTRLLEAVRTLLTID
jgi:hypothetical protein